MGISGRIAKAFLQSQLTPLLALLGLLLGAFAVLVTPREEEPQINVTMANVFIPFPGASAKEVENLVTTPAEQVLSQLTGIEHVYSVTKPGLAILTVQFKVGEDRISALVRLSIPIVLANILQSAYQITDTFWVGRLNAEAVAAVSLAFPISFLMIAIGFLGAWLWLKGRLFQARWYHASVQFAWPLGFIAIGEKLSVLQLLGEGVGQAGAIDAHFRRYSELISLAEIFWGLWLAPYGLLVLKSRAIPWFFGVALILGCCAYVAGVIVPLFWDGYFAGPIGQFAGIPGSIGEIGGALWLTVFGARLFERR